MAQSEESDRERAEIAAALREAESDLAAGRYRDYSDGELPALAAELKREARAQREHKLA